MPDAIIAVGGTGKRAALLYLKLVNTLRPTNITAPGSNIFVVDMDPEPGTADGNLNDQLIIEGVPNSHFISPVPQDARIDRTITLSRFMGFEEGRAKSSVAHTCFNREQLNVQIIRGMNCEPTVGAIVAARRFKEVDPDSEVTFLEGRLAQFERVIIVGSIIGGTGAGVMPQLATWIRKRLSKPIYGLLFLKWIEIPNGGVNEPNDVKIAGNTKAWLNYLIEHHPENTYGQHSDLFHHYVLIGTPQGMPLNRSDNGNHHPIHLLGALYLLQFDQFLQIAPGATGPHCIELGRGIKADGIQVGEDSIGQAVVRERLFALLLDEFCQQQPDEALSPFTLFMQTKLSWQPFIETLEKHSARWSRRRQLSTDWNDICRIFRQRKNEAENRIEELKDLTDNMPGARDIFDFNWNHLSEQAERSFPEARRGTKRSLKSESVVYPGFEQTIIGVANGFITQLRKILRESRF